MNLNACLLAVSFIVSLSLPSHAMTLKGGIEATVVTPVEPGIVGMDIIVPKQGYPVIKQVFSDAPASQAGLQQGDVIVKIDGRLSLGKTAQEIDVAIPDIPGTPVTFTVQRREGVYKTVTLIVAPLSRSTASNQAVFGSTKMALNH